MDSVKATQTASLRIMAQSANEIQNGASPNASSVEANLKVCADGSTVLREHIAAVEKHRDVFVKGGKPSARRALTSGASISRTKQGELHEDEHRVLFEVLYDFEAVWPVHNGQDVGDDDFRTEGQGSWAGGEDGAVG